VAWAELFEENSNTDMCIFKLCLTREKRALSGDVRLCLSVANITLRLFSAESAAVNVVCLLLGGAEAYHLDLSDRYTCLQCFVTQQGLIFHVVYLYFLMSL